MTYNAKERPARRADRALSREEAEAILQDGSYGVLSLAAQDGPYGVPLNYLYQDGALYFHGAREGLKTDCLRADPRACFTVVTCATPTFDGRDFSTQFRSAVALGVAEEIEDEARKRDLLIALCQRHMPRFADRAAEAVEGAVSVTAVWRLAIDWLSGKAKE